MNSFHQTVRKQLLFSCLVFLLSLLVPQLHAAEPVPPAAQLQPSVAPLFRSEFLSSDRKKAIVIFMFSFSAFAFGAAASRGGTGSAGCPASAIRRAAGHD